MDVNKHEFVESDLTYQVIGCPMTVLNELGHGLREKTYERALCVEFKEQNLSYSAQQSYPVYYKGEHIDDNIPDLEVEKRLIVEVKTVENTCNEHIGQVLNYLKIAGIEAGIILNFAHPKLEWKKDVLTQNSKQ